MKYYYIKIFIIFGLVSLLVWTNSAYAEMPLLGKIIVVDAGHGGIG